MNTSAQLLFEFLRSILYDTEVKKLNIQCIEPELRDLAEGMNYLADCVGELREYSKALSTGELSNTDIPRQYDELCMNLKNLHANLNHLTWQAQQVAEGDYSQHVSYLGEFSVAFNKMTEQLADRERMMKQEAEDAEKRASQFESYNKMLVSLTSNRPELILVVEKKGDKVLYCNKCPEDNNPPQSAENMGMGKTCTGCRIELPVCDKILAYKGDQTEKEWEIGTEEGESYFLSHTYPIVWEGNEALVHIVEDITREKQEELNLTDLAYRDPGTGFYNRRFMRESLAEAIRKDADYTFVFIDIDDLKFVNDNFGHQEGDLYIRTVGEAVQSGFRKSDIMARLGGDEFGALLENCNRETAKAIMDRVYKEMQEENRTSGIPYKRGFSYGFAEIKKNDKNISVEEIMKQADSEMYGCKQGHKQNYNSIRE